MPQLAIYDLRSDQCHYAITPNDAPKHFFCGEPVEYAGCPYCPTHAALCFNRETEEVKRARAQRAALARAAKKAQSSCLPFGRQPSATPKF